MSQKSDDTETIPLCYAHHDEAHKIGKKKFAVKYNLDIPELLRHLQAKPTMKVESGQLVAYIDSKKYVVGPVSIGIEEALKQVKQWWWEDRKIA